MKDFVLKQPNQRLMPSNEIIWDLSWLCLKIAVFLHRCHMIGPSHIWHYGCNVQVRAIMYLNDVQRTAFYEGIGLDTGVGGIWTGQRHRTTDICEE